MGSPFTDVTDVQVGDTIRFSWTEGFTHNVYYHPSGTCDVTDSVFIGMTSPVNYTVPIDMDNKIITFACQIGNHCKLLQLLVL